jgi:hypothetical protein
MINNSVAIKFQLECLVHVRVYVGTGEKSSVNYKPTILLVLTIHEMTWSATV